MEIHLHELRKRLAWIVAGVLLLGPIAFSFAESARPSQPAPVLGKVSLAGHPVQNAMICFDRGGVHVGFAAVCPDGSFRLHNLNMGDGLEPGHYMVHLYPLPDGAELPAKFSRAENSGLDVQIFSDWNYLDLDLR